MFEAREAGNGYRAHEIRARARQIARERVEPSYSEALNCSGTILNTGLGRARLAPTAAEALRRAASHVVLETDLETGKRGDRQKALAAMLRELTGAEDAFVVNNNAAAVMLAVNTFASGKSVLLSRGQSVEIGGSFRMPDVVRAAGARLIDVGTTNKTKADDYEKSAEEDTAVILRCHPSNFVMKGFVKEPSIGDMAAVAKKKKLILIDDAGSGCLLDTTKYGLPKEATLSESLKGGADLVTASGDKLLGGPQAGIIAGKRKLIRQIAKNPLARAVRIDKLTAAALEATLRLYIEGRELEIPTWKYIAKPLSEIRNAAQEVLARLKTEKIAAAMEDSVCEIGGGSLPGVKLPSCRIVINAVNAGDTARRLRMGKPPIIPYIEKGCVRLDLRTVEERELELLAEGTAAALK